MNFGDFEPHWLWLIAALLLGDGAGTPPDR